MKIPNLVRDWYQAKLTLFTLLLLPLSWIFGFFISARCFLYRMKIKKTHHFSAPVIVVGNITVGGTGKTPLVIWLAQFLASHGFKPGIVSRGMGGKKQPKPHWVTLQDEPNEVGDEAILLAKRTKVPMVICVDRVAAVQELLQKTDCTIIISDDGLQHYAMGREIEIAVIDGERQLGNRCLLPAGPLRELPKRLKQVDFVVYNGQNVHDNNITMQLETRELVSIENEQIKKSLQDFSGHAVHAVAAIGNPKRFFSLLCEHQLKPISHIYPDHYLFEKNDIDFGDDLPVIMTEKDAVKCKKFVNGKYWYLLVEAKVDATLGKALLKKLDVKLKGFP